MVQSRTVKWVRESGKDLVIKYLTVRWERLRGRGMATVRMKFGVQISVAEGRHEPKWPEKWILVQENVVMDRGRNWHGWENWDPRERVVRV